MTELWESNTPQELRDDPSWLLWRYEDRNGKPTKVPHQPDGRPASSTNKHTWSTFAAVVAAYQRGGFDGIGFVFHKGNPYAGADIDDATEDEAREWIDEFDSYTERSPSGNGYHIICRAELPKGTNRTEGELYSSGRFFTMTGDVVRAQPVREAQDAAEKYYAHLHRNDNQPSTRTRTTTSPRLTDSELISKAEKAKNGAKFQAVYRGGGDFKSDSEGDLALASLLAFYTPDEDQIERVMLGSGRARDKWGKHPTYLRDTIRKAIESKQETYSPGVLLEGTTTNGHQTNEHEPQTRGSGRQPTHDELRDRWIEQSPHNAHGLGDWRRYENGIFSTVSETAVKGEISGVIEAAKPEGIKPTASILASVTELSKIKVYVPDERWDANPDILVCQNGALQISSGKLLNHSPEHYATSAVPYNYDPDAVPPMWRYFLKETIPAEADFLQEFAGYALTTDTAQEIALWLFGPPGSGKSTALAGLQAMLGHRAGILGLADLERSRFTLADLTGKTLVIASEQPSTYLASTNTLNAIISGEPLQVERKYRDPYTIVPRAKVCWAMNELPRVADANSGLFRRVKIIQFPALPESQRSPELKRNIAAEGSGILNWALEGLRRVRERGHFEIPPSVREATAEFQESNDVPALFVEDRCIRGEGFKVQAQKLYDEYVEWCNDNGHRPQSSTRVAPDWARLGFERSTANGRRVYRGVQLRLPGERL